MLDCVILIRKYNKHSTMGRLILPSGKVLSTIERPWLNNKSNISCIPPGEYLVKWLPRSGSGKYKRVWHVQNVPGRTGILFHSANLVRHLQGCIAPGMKQGKSNGLDCVFYSRKAINQMRKELSGKDFMLRII